MAELNDFHPLAEFNSLVRQAYSAQEKWDMFDPRSDEDQITLKRLSQDWELANITLIKLVLEHGQRMLEDIDRKAKPQD